ncbi:unnamed protein product [Cochlearia groenlandica]
MFSSLLRNLSSKTTTLGKFVLRSSSYTTTRTTTNPYLLYRVLHYGKSLDDKNVTSNIHYFDPVKEEEVVVADKSFPMELRKRSCLVGMSHGWGVFMVDDGTDNHTKDLYVTDYYNPCGSKSFPKIMHLYNLPGGIYRGQVDVVTNVAMTCSPDDDDDFVVAVNFLGTLINFSRPSSSSSSPFKRLINPFPFFDYSKIVHSKRDKKFYAPSFGGHLLESWDDEFFEQKQFETIVKDLIFRNRPHLIQSEWELLDSCFKSIHLAESPSGQRFLIKWYAQNYRPGEETTTFLCRGTKRFMVFVADEEAEEAGVMRYTEDIGDLCIFLGKNDPFCVKASSIPGLKPNAIYFAGPDGFGVYDIATRKPRSFHPKSPLAFSTPSFLPYWIPPINVSSSLV